MDDLLLKKIADGRTDLIVDFLNLGRDYDYKRTNGPSLLSIAAYYGDVTAMKLLIHAGASLDDLGLNMDLNGAAFHGHWRLCQYLLEQGADPNYQLTPSFERPLHVCISKANNPYCTPIVKLLLHYGANPNVQTANHEETGCFMRDAYTMQETPLHRAAAFGSSETIQTLIEYGADKTIKDRNGHSPLSWASWHLRPGKILGLLTYGKHKLHELHINYMQSDHGFGIGGGLMGGLKGEIHLE